MRLPILNGENYAEWLELLELTLGYMNLDLAINEEKPEDLTNESTPDQRDYYAKWQRSNNMSLRLIKANMSRTIRRSIPDKPTAREYLDAIKEQYVSTDSSTVSTLIEKLGAIKYSESKDVPDEPMPHNNEVVAEPVTQPSQVQNEALWDELSSYTFVPECNVITTTSLAIHENRFGHYMGIHLVIKPAIAVEVMDQDQII
ncbi:hypothetical protein NE237_023520 [Protea cynaroides]|uniref:Gag protein n=1 Tax=Protea cynaroides TaxID=273540 RepID=A0A9Q0HE67_9MAGN|nr:hypothetical protein NE237_023520 [Protea cynaroides]